MDNKNELSDAIDVLKKYLMEDTSEGSYYYSWQSNIAMAFVDEFNKEHYKRVPVFTKWLFLENGINIIFNNAAKSFLDSLCADKSSFK